VFCVQEEAGKL